MDFQILLNAYQFIYQNARHSKNTKKIMGIMYATNQDYFTTHDLVRATDLDIQTIQKSLQKMMELDEIRKREIPGCNDEFEYGLNVMGIIQNLKRMVNNKKHLTNLIENILANRDNSNEELNQFLKIVILLNSEIVDFAAQRMNTYFDELKKQS